MKFPAKFPANWRWGLALLLVLLAGLAVYLMRPDVAGMLYDDGMYLMAAKALAHGQGYRLTGIEGQPFLYKYPPLYPLCLAGLWLLNPQFPGNLPWLKGFNILLSVSTLALLAWHYRRNLRFSPWVNMALIASLGLNMRFIGPSIELMSEPLFLLLSTGTLVWAYRYDSLKQEDNQKPDYKALGLLIILSAAAFYTRSMGLTLIGALALWLWLKGQRKTALLYTVSCGVMLLPWFIWSALKPSTTLQVGDFLVRSFQETYFESFKMDLRYEYSFLELYRKGVQELIGNFSVHFFPLLEWLLRGKATLLSDGFILILSFGLFCFLGNWAYKNAKAGRFSPSGLYILLYMLILPSWSFFKVYPRFMIVLLPFLLAAFIQAVLSQNWVPKVKHAVIGGFLGLMLCTNAIHLWPYLHKPVPDTLVISPYYDIWKDYQATFRFFNEKTEPQALTYSANIDESYLYALNTKARLMDFFIFYPMTLLDKYCGNSNLTCVLQHMQQRAEVLYRLLQQKHAQYIVYQRFAIQKDSVNNWTLGLKKSPPLELLLQAHPQSFIPVMETADGWITVYRFQPGS